MRPSNIALIFLCVVIYGAVAQNIPKTVHQDAFSIIGIEVRTTGEAEMTDEGAIPSLWQKFYSENTLDKIPDKADLSVYALYTDYARDRMGAYTVVIGAKVKGRPRIPDGLVMKTVPAGDYAILPSETGPPATVIPMAWQKVAALEDKDMLGGKRAYRTDYEVYRSSTVDPHNAQADLYVGLKTTPK